MRAWPVRDGTIDQTPNLLRGLQMALSDEHSLLCSRSAAFMKVEDLRRLAPSKTHSKHRVVIQTVASYTANVWIGTNFWERGASPKVLIRLPCCDFPK